MKLGTYDLFFERNKTQKGSHMVLFVVTLLDQRLQENFVNWLIICFPNKTRRMLSLENHARQKMHAKKTSRAIARLNVNEKTGRLLFKLIHSFNFC